MSSESVEYTDDDIVENVELGLSPRGNNNNNMPNYVHADNTVEFLATITNFDEPLYHVVTSHGFEDYARKALLPYYGKLSRKLLRRKIVEIYERERKYLEEMFGDFDGRLVVSYVLWSSFSGEDRYACVICHWINDEWGLEKRVIGFDLLDPYGYDDVACRIVEVLEEFDVKGKVGSISFDDGVSKKCMEHLGVEFDPKVLELFCHDRSFANAVDLCGQLIVDQLAKFIDPIRDLVKWFWSCPDKRREYKTLCESKRVLPMRFSSDFSRNWYLTFEYLEFAQRSSEALTKVYNECGNHSPLVDSQWDAIFKVIGLLEKFHGAFARYSWANDVNCHLVIYDCITIIQSLKSYENDPRFCSVVRNVRSKWIELFPEIPTIYCVASILDPRVKVEGLRQLLAYYYQTVDVNYNVDEKVGNSKNALQQLRAHYTVALRSGEGDKNSSNHDVFDMFKNARKRKRVDDEEKGGDLGEYLTYEFEFSEDENDPWFEILKWWKRKEELFPVLSKIAKEVLCTPISTTIPKSDRCPGKRVLDEKRSRLRQDLIEVCICKKDWDLAYEGRMCRDEDYTSDSSDSEAGD